MRISLQSVALFQLLNITAFILVAHTVLNGLLNAVYPDVLRHVVRYSFTWSLYHIMLILMCVGVVYTTRRRCEKIEERAMELSEHLAGTAGSVDRSIAQVTSIVNDSARDIRSTASIASVALANGSVALRETTEALKPTIASFGYLSDLTINWTLGYSFGVCLGALFRVGTIVYQRIKKEKIPESASRKLVEEKFFKMFDTLIVLALIPMIYDQGMQSAMTLMSMFKFTGDMMRKVSTALHMFASTILPSDSPITGQVQEAATESIHELHARSAKIMKDLEAIKQMESESDEEKSVPPPSEPREVPLRYPVSDGVAHKIIELESRYEQMSETPIAELVAKYETKHEAQKAMWQRMRETLWAPSEEHCATERDRIARDAALDALKSDYEELFGSPLDLKNDTDLSRLDGILRKHRMEGSDFGSHPNQAEAKRIFEQRLAKKRRDDKVTLVIVIIVCLLFSALFYFYRRKQLDKVLEARTWRYSKSQRKWVQYPDKSADVSNSFQATRKADVTKKLKSLTPDQTQIAATAFSKSVYEAAMKVANKPSDPDDTVPESFKHDLRKKLDAFVDSTFFQAMKSFVSSSETFVSPLTRHIINYSKGLESAKVKGQLHLFSVRSVPEITRAYFLNTRQPSAMGLVNYIFYHDAESTWDNLTTESSSSSRPSWATKDMSNKIVSSLIQTRDEHTTPAMREALMSHCVNRSKMLIPEALISAPKIEVKTPDFGYCTSEYDGYASRVFFIIAHNCIITVHHAFKDVSFCKFTFDKEEVNISTADPKLVVIGKDLVAYPTGNKIFQSMRQWKLAEYNTSIQDVVLRCGNSLSTGKVVNTNDIDGLIGCSYSSQYGDCGSPVTSGNSLTAVGFHVATNQRENFFSPITSLVKEKLQQISTAVPKNLLAPASL